MRTQPGGLAGLIAGALLAVALLVSPAAQAQLIQGGIDGLVTDTTDAAIVGAEVTITNEATGQVRNTTTGVAGNYTFPTVNTGTYSVSVRSEGFQVSTTTGVIVSQNNVTRVNARLEVGQVTEVVTVEATAATLQTDRAEVRQEVTEKTLRNIPVPLGRNYQMLFVTLPGFSPPQNAHSVPTNPSRAVRFSVNGTSRSNNNTRIDGASSTNIWVPHMTGYNPALESIETVNVVTNSFDAEQGTRWRRRDQPADQVRHERCARLGVPLPHEPASEGVPVLQQSHRKQAEVHQQPVRWHHRRTDQGEQVVLLRQLRRHLRVTVRPAIHRHADRGDALRGPVGFPHAHLRSIHRHPGHACERLCDRSHAIRQQHDSAKPHRQRRSDHDPRPRIPGPE